MLRTLGAVGHEAVDVVAMLRRVVLVYNKRALIDAMRLLPSGARTRSRSGGPSSGRRRFGMQIACMSTRSQLVTAAVPADVMVLARELLGCRERLETALHSGSARGAAATKAGRALGWRPGQRVADACATMVHLCELAQVSGDDPELEGELRDEMDEGLEQLADALVDATGTNLSVDGADSETNSVTGASSSSSSCLASDAAVATVKHNSATPTSNPPESPPQPLLAVDATSELAELMARLAAAVAAAQPAPKCHHRWVPLGSYHDGATDRPGSGSARVHNRGDGKGKYLAYRCVLCDKFQRRHSDLRDQ